MSCPSCNTSYAITEMFFYTPNLICTHVTLLFTLLLKCPYILRCDSHSSNTSFLCYCWNVLLYSDLICTRSFFWFYIFDLLILQERPRWLEITTVRELKTKVGHVIVMLLLIGFFDKSKKAVIQSPLDLLCFSTSVLLCSGCLFLLSKLNDSKWFPSFL